MNPWTLDDFGILQELGTGQSASVQHAVEISTGNHVALKILNKSNIHNDNRKRQLTRQIEIQSRLNHPAICQLYGFFETTDKIYMVTEYCQGGMLFNICRDGILLGETSISSIMRQLLQAACYMHNRRIIHRDLKLENIILTKEKQCKIIDFGWCVHSAKKRSTFCGTTQYLTPEMILGQQYSSEIDIYCLGVILYELLFLKSPFFKEKQEDTLNDIVNCQVVFPEDKRIASEAAKDLVRLMINKNWWNRPSARQLLQHQFIK